MDEEGDSRGPRQPGALNLMQQVEVSFYLNINPKIVNFKISNIFGWEN